MTDLILASCVLTAAFDLDVEALLTDGERKLPEDHQAALRWAREQSVLTRFARADPALRVRRTPKGLSFCLVSEALVAEALACTYGVTDADGFELGQAEDEGQTEPYEVAHGPRPEGPW